MPPRLLVAKLLFLQVAVVSRYLTTRFFNHRNFWEEASRCAFPQNLWRIYMYIYIHTYFNFFFKTNTWGNESIWPIFSTGLKPRTSSCMCIYIYVYNNCKYDIGREETLDTRMWRCFYLQGQLCWLLTWRKRMQVENANAIPGGDSQLNDPAILG